MALSISFKDSSLDDFEGSSLRFKKIIDINSRMTITNKIDTTQSPLIQKTFN